MKRRRHTPEQVIRKLREAERRLGEGKEVGEVCRHLEISEATYHRWQRQFGGMKADEVKRLKDLERENQRLKRIVADQALEAQALREVAKGNGEPGDPSGRPPTVPPTTTTDSRSQWTEERGPSRSNICAGRPLGPASVLCARASSPE